jgi:hypothetical protein
MNDLNVKQHIRACFDLLVAVLSIEFELR